MALQAARLFCSRIMHVQRLAVASTRSPLAHLPFSFRNTSGARTCSPAHASTNDLAKCSSRAHDSIKTVSASKRCYTASRAAQLRTRPTATSRRSVSSVTATSLQIELVPCLDDNYSFLIHDPETGITAAVDPADDTNRSVAARFTKLLFKTEPKPFEDILESRGLQLNFILNTHHHWDHVGGNEALKQKYGATVVRFSVTQSHIWCFHFPATRGMSGSVNNCLRGHRTGLDANTVRNNIHLGRWGLWLTRIAFLESTPHWLMATHFRWNPTSHNRLKYQIVNRRFAILLRPPSITSDDNVSTVSFGL
eukprot:1190680-Prorocentrum_minimum.AAC.3